MERSVYVVLSQTGSILSRILKFFTRDEYNHSSISLTPTLEEMYSFGRLNPYKPFPGGFVKEGKNTGTFKRFYKTTAKVLEFKVDEESYNQLKLMLKYMEENKNDYKYNYMGVLRAVFNKNYEPKGKFYCSQFVRFCLDTFNISNAKLLPRIVKPMDFMNLKEKRIIYTGVLSSYNCI